MLDFLYCRAFARKVAKLRTYEEHIRQRTNGFSNTFKIEGTARQLEALDQFPHDASIVARSRKVGVRWKSMADL